MPNGFSNACLVVTHNGTTYAGIPGDPTIEFVGNAGNDKFTNNTDRPSVARGGSGNDTLIGGSGPDTLYGDTGSLDVLSGRAGDDVLYAASTPNGEETSPYGLAPQSYNTFVFNNLHGGADNDILHGSLFNDNMAGGGGSDSLYGYGGQDLLHGDEEGIAASGPAEEVAGNDLLFGGTGVDALVGHAGNDKLFANGSAYPGYSMDIYETSIGSPSAGTPLPSFGDWLFGDEATADGTIGIGTDELTGDAGTDFLYGGGGNDQLVGGSGADVMHGGEGNDTIYGYTLTDSSGGSSDYDRFYGEGGRDTLYGRDGGADLLDAGGSELDTVYGDEVWYDDNHNGIMDIGFREFGVDSVARDRYVQIDDIIGATGTEVSLADFDRWPGL